MVMAELAVKEEPMDFEFVTPRETKESNGDTLQPKKSCSAALQSTKDERSQPESIFEQIFVKEEIPGEPSESMQKEKSASQSCHDVAETQEYENNDPEVFNIQEEVEITIDDVKMEVGNWTNESPTTENAKKEKPKDHLTKGEIESSENKFVDKKDVINIQEDIEITIEDMKIEAYNEEKVMNDSRTDDLLKTNKNFHYLCSVNGCLKSRFSDPALGFIGFPVHNKDLCKQWIHSCGDDSLHSLSKSALVQRGVCEKHFTEDSFGSILRRVLKKDAVPIKASSSPAEGDTGLTKDAVPTEASSSSAEGGIGLTKDAVPIKASSSPAEGDTGLTKDAIPTEASSSSAEGGIGLTKDAVPIKAGSSPAEGGIGLTKDAVPTKAGSSPAEGGIGLTKDAVPIKAGSSPAEGGIGLTKDAVPIKAGSSPAEGNTGVPMALSDLSLEPEQMRKIYILGLDYDTTEETLQVYFEFWGDIVDLVVRKDPQTKRSRGYGFVTYTHSEMVNKVMLHHPHIIDGREVLIERATLEVAILHSKADLLSKTKFTYYNRCSFMGCQSKTDDPSLQFFWFPVHSEELCKKWILNCGVEALLHLSKSTLSRMQVCEKHFTKDSFESILGRKLQKKSVPSKLVFDDSSPSQEHVDDINTEPSDNEKIKEKEPSKHSTEIQNECTEKNSEKCTGTSGKFSIQEDIDNTAKDVIITTDNGSSHGGLAVGVEDNTFSFNQQEHIPFDDIFEKWEEEGDNFGHGWNRKKTETLKEMEDDLEVTREAVSKKNINEVMNASNYDNSICKVSGNCQATSNIENPAAESDEPSELVVGKSKLNPKRVWDKRDCCIFCLNLVTNFTRHIIRNHENEIEVGKILANPKGSRERKLLFEQLRKKGNFFHNKKCIREKTGSIIVTQRPGTINPVAKYLPCRVCLGFYAQESLYRHMRKCKLKTPSDSSKNARSFGAMLLVVTPDGFESLKEKVFPIMKHDNISKAAQEDSLICEFGARMLQYPKDHHMKTLVSQKMRELARLKLEMKAKITGIPGKNQFFNQLEDFLHPDLYKQIVHCVHSVAGYDEEAGRFKIPSLAKKLGCSLQRCAELMECKGLILSNEELRKRGEAFSKLLEKMRKCNVSMNASKPLSMDSWNKPKMLQLAEDIKRLHEFLVTKEKNLFVQLSQHPSELIWRELAEISLVRIILLNCRRSGEAQRIKLSQYNTINNQPIHSDATDLSDVEKNVCQSFSRFHIQDKSSGRTGRLVTVLLTSEMRKSIDVLIATREKANINPENPYLFSIAKTTHSCIRGSDVLRKYAKLVKAKLPESIKSINLRKQVATMSQLLNLKENDIDSLATFMGHSVNVHKEYCRLPDDVLQMAKISYLLLALESGKIKELKGLNFDNISVSDCEELNSEPCLNNKPPLSTSMIIKEKVPSPLDAINIIPESSSPPMNQSIANEEPSDTMSKSLSKIATKKRRATCVKRPWSEREKDALIKHFLNHMIYKKVPNKEECIKCIEEEICLSERSWSHVKFQVYRIGDFVYAEPKKRGTDPILLNIQRLWANQEGQQMLYGNRYSRPREIYHFPIRKFREKEVFKTDQHVTIPLNQVLGHCCVLSVKDYFHSRPENFEEKDVYICESLYSSKTRAFKKIKNWPQSLMAGYKLVPQDKVLEPKRVMYLFREKVGKHKEEAAEVEEKKKLVEKEKQKGENESSQINKQTATQSSTHTLLFDDVLNSWCLPEDNSEISDLTYQDEGIDVDKSQQPLTCEDESAVATCNSNFPTLEVRTPIRTYKRTAPKRQRPDSWGAAQNKEEKQGKVTKTDTSSKSHSEKERNILDLSYYIRNEEINAEVKAIITSPPTSLPKGENQENATGSTPTVTLNFFHNLHSCLYCNQLVSEIKQHLVKKHTNEEEVKIIVKLNNNNAREKELILLTRVGDFKHNSRVLEKGNGLLIDLGGRCHDISTFDKDAFMSCPNCAGFVHVHSLKHHHNSCLFKDMSLPITVERNMFVESQAMLAFLKKQKFNNLTHYFSKRLKSIFGTIAKNDELIMLFIPYLFSSKKCQDSSAVLVLLQRLGFILQLYRRLADDPNIKFHHILRPECVELLLKALQSFFSEVKETDRAGLYKGIYSHIAMSAFIWRGKCLINGDLKSAVEALQFFYHFTNMYQKKLFTDLVNRNKVNSTRPVESISLHPAEVISFKNSLNERIVQMTNTLCDEVVSNKNAKFVWHELAEATMCLICLTNPVDFVAIEGIKLTEYAVRPDNAIDDLTKYKSMILPYRIFSENHIFVCTEYLGSEIVITLSSTVKKAIDILIKRRKEAGIPLAHPNIFSGCHDSALSAMNSFYKKCIKHKGVFPEDVIRDLKKRRQISHIIHISDMSCGEMEKIKDCLKSSNDHKSTLQISPEDCYKSEIEKEFREALHTYEVSQGRFQGSNNNLTKESKLFTPLDKVKHSGENEIPQYNNVEAGSTHNKYEEIEPLPPSGAREKKDACTQTSKTSKDDQQNTLRNKNAEENIPAAVVEVLGNKMGCVRDAKAFSAPRNPRKRGKKSSSPN